MNQEHPIQIIARVRRAMPRNQDVMAVCDALEKELQYAIDRRVAAGIPTGLPPDWPAAKREFEQAKAIIGQPKSRAEIQREYRQRKKAKKP